MSREIVPFVLTGPVPICLEGGTQFPRVGCCSLTMTFKQPTQVGEITFKNYYTWAVSVHILRSKIPHSGGDPEVNWRDPSAWQVAVANKVLMPHPHTEAGSHDHVSITCLESAVEWQDVAAMRLILRQSSSVWQNFMIENITTYRELPRLPPFSVPIMSPNAQVRSSNINCSSPLGKLIGQTQKALSREPLSDEDNLTKSNYEISTLQYS